MASELNANKNESLRESEKFVVKVKNIHKEDLKYVEKDLSFNEKVSMAFLLFGCEKTNANYILQRLLIISKSNTSDSDILESYVKINPEWRYNLLEALSIIKAKRIIRKLGFNPSDLYIHFLPHIPETSLHINQHLKAMYILCEKLTPAEAGKMILDINDEVNCHLQFYDHSFMEIFLLDWITKSIITIASGKNNQSSPPNVDIILQYFKLHEMYLYRDWLSSCIHIPKQSKEICGEDKKLELKKLPNHQNVRDSAFASGTQQCNEFDRKDSGTIISDSCYIVRKETAGFALIINQKDFYEDPDPDLKEYLPSLKLNERKGTDVDKEQLKTIFSTFGYIPKTKDNLSHFEVLHLIQETVKRSIAYDSLVVCILSHGIKGAVYGSNSIPIEIAKIEEILTANSLLNKPKWLIVQACQGDQIQLAKPIGRLENDGINTAPAYSDMITAMSTVPGFASIRHTERGTWFIQSLCKKIDELGDRKHVLDILTAVNLDVGNKRGLEGQCMVPLTSQTLRKSYFLPKRF